MLKYSRNLCLYPNVYLMDQFSSQIRHFRPISVDKTEVTIYCIAPKGESAEARTARIRQYEDFFNASGMATPDDLEEFRSCQKTYLAERRAVERHEPRRRRTGSTGRDDDAKALGLEPVLQRGRAPRTRASTSSSTATGRKAHARRRRRREPPRGSERAEPCTDIRPMSHDHREVEQFLYREARYLDDREFDKWLECYAPDAEFWMPSWDDDDTLVTDPQTRDLADLLQQPRRPGGPGLPDQDRPVQRDQPARAAHQPQHLQRRDRGAASDVVEVRFNWLTLYYRYQNIDPYFGTSFYTIDFTGAEPLIKKKKVVLKNDYIHHVVDIYHV